MEDLRARGILAAQESSKLKQLQAFIREKLAREEAIIREAQAAGVLGPITLSGDLESDAETRLEELTGLMRGAPEGRVSI